MYKISSMCNESNAEKDKFNVQTYRSGSLLILYLTEVSKSSVWLDAGIVKYVRLVAERVNSGEAVERGGFYSLYNPPYLLLYLA